MSSKFRSTRIRTGPSVRSGPGPLRNLIDRISLLESKVVSLESELRLAKRKLGNYERNSNASDGITESLIDELLTSKLSKQQFAMTLVPITDDIRISSISGGGATTSAPKARVLVPVPCSSPFQTQTQTVLIKTDPDAPEILGDESTTNCGFTNCDFDQDMGDIDIEWGLQNTDCDSEARDPDWKAYSNTSQPDTTKKRKRAETEQKQDLSGYQIEVVKSKAGKPLLAINGFTFRKHYQNGQIAYWVCTKSAPNNKCRARCKTFGPNDEVVSVSPEEIHGHSSDSTEIEKRKVIAKLKAEATLSTEKTAKLVQSTMAELSQGVNNDVARVLNAKQLRNSINRLRKKSHPTPSTSNSETQQNQIDGDGGGQSDQDQEQPPQEVGHTVGVGT